MKILAVDDSPTARKLFQAVLLRLGVSRPDLRFASSGAEALQLFAQWRPDLVFVDIELGGRPARPLANPPGAASPPTDGAAMDGDDLARQMLQRSPQTKVVVVTAFDQDHPRVKTLLASGVSDVIVKPLLAARVKQILDQFQPPTAPSGRRRTSPAWS